MFTILLFILLLWRREKNLYFLLTCTFFLVTQTFLNIRRLFPVRHVTKGNLVIVILDVFTREKCLNVLNRDPAY